MRSKKLACVGDRPSTSGVRELVLALVAWEPMVAESPTVWVGVEAIDAPVVTRVETTAPVSAPTPVLETETFELVSGSENSGSSATLGEDSKDTESDGADVGLAAGLAVEPTVPVVEDDSWYQNILNFVHQDAKGDVGAPQDFAWVHIPHD